MNKTNETTLVKMLIPSVAAVQALVHETPVSLTLTTPQADIQVQIGSVPKPARSPLPLMRRIR